MPAKADGGPFVGGQGLVLVGFLLGIVQEYAT